MRALTPRGIISEAAIVLGVCAGLGMAVISRFDAERDDLERDLTNATKLMSHRGEIEQSQSLWMRQRERARVARDSMRSLSEPASTAAVLHERIMGMARDCEVRIDRIQPGQQSAPEPASASDDPTAPKPVLPKAVLSNTIDAEGRYDSMVRFIERLESLGLGRINDVRLTPLDTGNEQLVRASVSTVHVAFDTKDLATANASFKGGTP